MSTLLDRIATMSPKRVALLAHELNEQLEREKQRIHQPIAVVGLACRLPGGADDGEALWRLLASGADLVTPAPADRWQLDQPVEAGARIPEAGFLGPIDGFDPLFFGISPRETETMDPQQRLLLEVTWEALENAAISPDSLRGTRAGVFIGIAGNDFNRKLLDQDWADLESYMASGGSQAIAAGRLSYTLDLTGPCVSVDTACSSSLTSIAHACDSLRLGRSDVALTGGVSLIITPELTVLLTKAGMLSPTFRSRSFDAAADGFARGEGCGMLVLKRLADAQRDGDRIHAAIRGVAINQDGRSAGLTAPSGTAQQALLREALADAGLEPGQVQYVEAHGTGTPLGDPIEARALTAVYGHGRAPGEELLLGSIKSNAGHLEAAAGVAGIIKLIVSLERGRVPPIAHLKTPNPHIEWESSGLSLPREEMAWPGPAADRVGGVSSFGFSGTNVHLLLSAAPAPAERASAATERSHHLFCLSARSPAALRALAGRYAGYLDAHPDTDLHDLCFSANRGRKHHATRAAFVVADIAELRERIGEFQPGPLKSGAEPQAPLVAFLFTGQGSQYAGMARALYHAEPAFAAILDECDGIFRDATGTSLLDLLYGDAPGGGARLDQTGFTQPALFALEVALARLLIGWGVRPTAVMGHSVGEYAAACISGVLALEDGLRLIARRAELMQALPAGGGMVAALTDEDTVRRAIAGFPALSVAGLNGPTNIVVSGPLADLDRLAKQLESAGTLVQRLTVSHAFHSSLLDPMLADLAAAADAVAFAEPRITLISNLTGREARDDDLQTGRYWREHARAPVRFTEGAETLRALGCKAFVEIGPQPVLTGMARRFIDDADAAWLPTLRPGRPDLAQLLESVGELYARGADIDFAAMYQGRQGRKLALPTYPFERERYWPEVKPRAVASSAPTRPAFADWLYEMAWERVGEPDAGGADASAAAGRWLIWLDPRGTGLALADALRARGGECVLVGGEHGGSAGAAAIDPALPGARALLAERIGDAPLRGAVYLGGLGAAIGAQASTADATRATEAACRGALLLAQVLATRRATGGALAFVVDDEASPAQTALLGMAAAITLELTALDVRRVVLRAGAERLADTLLRPADPCERVGETAREALRLARSVAVEAPSAAPAPRADATYLVTGGLTGLGLATARWLVDCGARTLVLAGRRDPDAEALQAIAELQGAGAAVTTQRADIGDPDHVARLFAAIDALPAPLAGVFHSAGAIADASLARLDWAQFTRVMRAKVEGAWNLHLATRARALDHFVLYSSGASFLGSAGQVNYAAANGFLDGLARQRRMQGLAALTVNWGPWGEIGMAAKPDVIAAIERGGVDAIDPESGFAALGRLMAGDRAQAAVLPIDWRAFDPQIRPDARVFARFFDRQATPASGPASGPAAAAAPAEPNWREKIDAAMPSQRGALIADLLERTAARTLRLKSSQSVRGDEPLSELGLDSLMAVQLRNDLAAALRIDPPQTLLFNYPTLDDLARYVMGELYPPLPETPQVQEPIAELDDLSEDELAQMLEELIGAGSSVKAA